VSAGQFLCKAGFSETTLYKYLEEGRKIVERIKPQQAIETTPPDVRKLAE
jgi:hypothetical protein